MKKMRGWQKKPASLLFFYDSTNACSCRREGHSFAVRKFSLKAVDKAPFFAVFSEEKPGTFRAAFRPLTKI